MKAAGKPDRASAALAASGPATWPAEAAAPSKALAASRSSAVTMRGGSALGRRAGEGPGTAVGGGSYRQFSQRPGAGHAEGGAQAAPQYPVTVAALGPIRSMYTPSNGLSRAGGAAQQMMVTETAYGPALNRYAGGDPDSTMAEAQPPTELTVLAGRRAKRSGNRETKDEPSVTCHGAVGSTRYARSTSTQSGELTAGAAAPWTAWRLSAVTDQQAPGPGDARKG